MMGLLRHLAGFVLAAALVASGAQAEPLRPLVTSSGLTQRISSADTLVDGSGRPYVAKALTAVNLYVDAVAGVDSNTCGTGTGALACKTIPQVTRNLCVNYSHSVLPTIHGVAGQTYTEGLSFTGGLLSTATPFCSGIANISFDGHGSTISTTNDWAVKVYYAPIAVELHNVTLQASGTVGAPILVRGTGFIGIKEGVTLGSAAPGFPLVWAYGGAQVVTCPVSLCPANTTLTITGSGLAAFLAQNGGGIQVEGLNVVNVGTPAFTLGYAAAAQNGTIDFVAAPISGATTGPTFNAVRNGVINTLGQTGGYSACPNNYLPGTTCGRMESGGMMAYPGTPTIASGSCGTGCFIQNSEHGFTIVYGTGLGSTSGTTYGPVRIRFATQTDYRACSLQPSDPAIGTPWMLLGAPAGSVNGFFDIYWKGNGSDPANKAIYVSCRSN
ncbi:hypothetical protein [Sphingobium chungbukense]|uniref:IPT/TIG domain-containing protein n=1 Tax=Sphingobium chungbukense TaxID=56193 RepID=A0A0M3AVM5_9SPHN|nr:hypothetical protein [Sphingobium chungbukense]KKW93968.1 hypothetical protein YP76_04880 [Sphingobium chungbukense]